MPDMAAIPLTKAEQVPAQLGAMSIALILTLLQKPPMNAIEAMNSPTAQSRLQPEYEARIMKIAGIVDAVKEKTTLVPLSGCYDGIY